MIDYRGLYESSTSLLLFNVTKDIASTVALAGYVKFKKKNRFTFGDKEVTGVILQQEGLFIIVGDDLIEFSEDVSEFNEFCKDPYNMITLYEKVCDELGLSEKKKRKKDK
jgi:hypothetical protein